MTKGLTKGYATAWRSLIVYYRFETRNRALDQIGNTTPGTNYDFETWKVHSLFRNIALREVIEQVQKRNKVSDPTNEIIIQRGI